MNADSHQEYRRINKKETFSTSELPVFIRLGKGAVNTFAIIDPSTEPDPHEGARDNKKISLNPDIKTLLICPTDYDVSRGEGYKGIRDGETIHMGRSDGDQLHRFKRLTDDVSRDHAIITKSPDGKTITVTDLQSMNGTYISKDLNDLENAKTLVEEWGSTVESAAEYFAVRDASGSSLASEKHPDRNEDAFLVDTENNVYAVFDGVGGIEGGDIASTAARKSAAEMARSQQAPTDLESVTTYLRKMLDEASASILDVSLKAATTAVITKVSKFNDELYASVAHSGDSRAYLLSDGVLMALTADHTPFRKPGYTLEAMRQQEVLADTDTISVLSPAEAEMFRRRNVIGASLGRGAEVHADIKHFPVKPGDTLLLTSDGVHDNLTTDEMQSLLANDGSKDLARTLVNAANKRAKEDHFRAKMDDITAVAIVI